MKILLASAVILICSSSVAQSYLNKSAHSFHSKTIDAVYLITKEGQGFELSYLNTAKSSLKLISQYSLSYDYGKLESGTTYNSYAASYNILKTIVKDKNNSFFINGGIGAYFSVEQGDNPAVSKSFDNLSPGAIGRLELEYYIRKLALTVNGQQLYRPWSDIGDLQWRVGFGLKYIIN